MDDTIRKLEEIARLIRIDVARGKAFAQKPSDRFFDVGIAEQNAMACAAGLAAAIFSPCMNISGSVLAGYWRKHPIKGRSARTEVEGEPVSEGEAVA